MNPTLPSPRLVPEPLDHDSTTLWTLVFLQSPDDFHKASHECGIALHAAVCRGKFPVCSLCSPHPSTEQQQTEDPASIEARVAFITGFSGNKQDCTVGTSRLLYSSYTKPLEVFIYLTLYTFNKRHLLHAKAHEVGKNTYATMWTCEVGRQPQKRSDAIKKS